MVEEKNSCRQKQLNSNLAHLNNKSLLSNDVKKNMANMRKNNPSEISPLLTVLLNNINFCLYLLLNLLVVLHSHRKELEDMYVCIVYMWMFGK